MPRWPITQQCLNWVWEPQAMLRNLCPPNQLQSQGKFSFAVFEFFSVDRFVSVTKFTSSAILKLCICSLFWKHSVLWNHCLIIIFVRDEIYMLQYPAIPLTTGQHKFGYRGPSCFPKGAWTYSNFPYLYCISGIFFLVSHLIHIKSIIKSKCF